MDAPRRAPGVGQHVSGLRCGLIGYEVLFCCRMTSASVSGVWGRSQIGKPPFMELVTRTEPPRRVVQFAAGRF